jgi:predicted DNA-binding transcriptional regulator AlpA
MLEDTKFISLKQVLELIPVSKSTWLRGVSAGEYPQSIKVSKRLRFWRNDDIQNLIAKLHSHEVQHGKK